MVVKDVRAWIAELEQRLEVWSAPDPVTGERTWLGIGDCDGIACRDETIKQQEARIAKLAQRICRKHIAMTMQMPCNACGQSWAAHSQSDAKAEG